MDNTELAWIILIKETNKRKFTQLVKTLDRTRNISTDNARTTSVWCDGMSLIT